MSFHLSVPRCVVVSLTLLSATALLADTPSANSPPQAAAKPAPDKKLNLKVPDVNRTLTPAQRRVATNGTRSDGSETVEVESQRAGGLAKTPKPPGGLASVFWAVAHPVQAWRVFFPTPPEQQQISAPPRND